MLTIVCVLIFWIGFESSLYAQTQSIPAVPDLKKTAVKLQRSTVTLRIGANEGQEKKGSTESTSPTEIVVFSGFHIGGGKIIAPLFIHPTKNIRITLPGGNQCLGETLVMDEYSGLCLISIDNRKLATVEVVPAKPAVGTQVLSGSGWGRHEPLISLGIVSGHGHQIAMTQLPPLMAVDVRTSRTSKGSPVVNNKGELLGVIMAMTTTEEGRWTYAVPAKYVQRLERAYKDNFVNSRTGRRLKDVGVVVLPRRRPILGMQMQDKNGEIVIVRVEEDGPAYKAGLRKEDRVRKVDGIKIRSVYQAVRPILAKQPGDEMHINIRRANKPLRFDILLGGESTFKPSDIADIAKYIVPQIQINKKEQPKNILSGSLVSKQASNLQQKITLLEDEKTTREKQIQLLKQEIKELRSNDSVISTSEKP